VASISFVVCVTGAIVTFTGSRSSESARWRISGGIVALNSSV